MLSQTGLKRTRTWSRRLRRSSTKISSEPSRLSSLNASYATKLSLSSTFITRKRTNLRRSKLRLTSSSSLVISSPIPRTLSFRRLCPPALTLVSKNRRYCKTCGTLKSTKCYHLDTWPTMRKKMKRSRATILSTGLRRLTFSISMTKIRSSPH